MLLTNNNTRAIITLWDYNRAYDGYILQRYRVNIFNSYWYTKLTPPGATINYPRIYQYSLGATLKIYDFDKTIVKQYILLAIKNV